MDVRRANLTAESLLSLVKYIIEIFCPSHKLATYNLEEVLSTFKHTLRNKRVRLKSVPVHHQLLRSLIPSCVSSKTVIDEETCTVVGTKAAILLGIPVGGSCWALASKCFCSVLSSKDCSPRCETSRQSGKVYALHIVSNRKLPPYKVLMNETMHHNIKTSLFGASSFNDENFILNVQRLNKDIGGAGFSPKYATKVVVSHIQQPHTVDHSTLSTCLMRFFETSRHIHKSDLLRIQLTEHAPEILLTSELFGVEDIYFQVKSIEGPSYGNARYSEESIGYLLVKGETTLVQDMNLQSFLPCCVSSSHSTLYKNVPTYPEGLKTVYMKFINTLRPFLRSPSPSLKPAFLIVGPTGSGKHSLVCSAAAQVGVHFWAIDCAEIRGATSGQTVGKLRAVMSKAKQYSPCILLMSNIQILGSDQDGHEDFRVLDEFEELLSTLKESKLPVIIVGTVTSSADLCGSFARVFLLEITIPVLEKEERKIQLRQLVSQNSTTATVSGDCLDEVASRCSSFLLGDLKQLVALALRNHLYDKLKVQKAVESDASETITLTIDNFLSALENMQSAYAGCIGAPKIPSVKWNDVGGLENVKQEILKTVTMPLKHPELTAGGLTRSGILLYGPPGTGKTLLAKAVATECNLNFLSVKGPELLNMYVGQSEANVREVFDKARGASPCIIFFDELDALAPNRGRNGDSGGVMDRVVSQLSSEMDGLQKTNLLFLIGATNRPDLIDPALLRPGRFDKLLYVGAYEDPDSKFSVLSALTRKFKLTPDVDLRTLSSKLPTEVTGADLYAVCSRAWLEAVRRIIKQSDIGAQEHRTEVEVNQEDFEGAVSKMVPSVSAEDMEYFRGLKKQLCS